ncbi:MAG: REP-associated tyrosine transposase [Limisphaerales bacterium]
MRSVLRDEFVLDAPPPFGHPADMTDGDLEWSTRSHPARGVQIDLGQPTIVFLTVCTKDRHRWMTQTPVQNALCQLWRQADAWLVGEYVLMPDHLHLFCAPRDLSCTLQRWVTWWKRKFSCRHLPQTGEWQRDFWDTRLRRSENYTQKWHYVQENPVRAGLVSRPEDWPYQGRLNVLPW